MEEFYNSANLADVLFIVQQQKIRAHSFILIIHSEVFRAQFDGTYHESKIIPITFTVEAGIFLEFLKYFYYSRCDLTTTNVIEIVKLAIKYKVFKLEQMCYEFLWSKQFYIDSLKFYEIYKAENLKFLLDVQLTKIAYNFDTFLYSDKFLALKRDTLEDILRLNCVWSAAGATKTRKKISESMIFERVVKWVEHHKKLYGQNEKQLIGNLIKLMRFPAMNMSEFLECVNKKPSIFECNQVCEVMSYITLKRGNLSFETIPRTIHFDQMQISKISDVKSHSTKFTVSDSVVMLGIWIQSPTIKQECTVKLVNQHYKILSEIRLCTLYEYFCCPVRFDGDIELNPFDEYCVTVYYDNLEVPVFLWSHFNDIDVVDNVIVHYSVQSPLIMKIILNVLQ